MTRLIVDANVLVRSILGKSSHVRRLQDAGADMIVVDVQVAEAYRVLGRLGLPAAAARLAIEDLTVAMTLADVEDVAEAEAPARRRLHERGQADWPVLAAALALDADIWSDDRDFFGVGVAIWSTPNVYHAISDGALNA